MFATCTRRLTQTNAHTCLRARAYARTHARKHTCTHTRAHTHKITHTHTHTHTRKQTRQTKNISFYKTFCFLFLNLVWGVRTKIALKIAFNQTQTSARTQRCGWACFCFEPPPKADSTLRSSQAVPHPSTKRALCRLTSEVERDPVHSTRYGRQRLRGSPEIKIDFLGP